MIRRWVLSVLMGLLGLANLIRAGMSFTMNPLLTRLNLAMFPILGGFYAVVGLVFLGLAILCGSRNHQCPAFITVLGYEIILWIVRILTFRSTYTRSLWMHDAVFSLIFLGIVYILSHKPISQKIPGNHRSTDPKLK